MSQGEQQPAQPVHQTEVAPQTPVNPPPVIGGDQWNKDITGLLTSNVNSALTELGLNPNVLRAFKDADGKIAQLRADKRLLENKCRDLSAHLALANNRIEFSKQDPHSMWKEVIYYRERYHILNRQHQEILQAHSTCATGPPEQPYIHVLRELEKLQDMYRHILGQNTTLKFEVQRLMQQCVNGGLIPPPQNYIVTPLPLLQPPSMQPGTARRLSEPTAGHQQQLQHPAPFTHAAQPGPVARQFISPPSNPYATNNSVPNNPAIVAGPIQAYNYHRAQFPQSQQIAAQLMPPPQQQGQPCAPQQQIPAVRSRQVIDLTNSDDERVHKRPRMASDPNIYTQHPAGPATHFQHQVYDQIPTPAPFQVLQQRNLQRSQLPPMDHTQAQLSQQYFSQRPGTGPAHQYQQIPPPPTPAFVGQYRVNALPNVPTPPTSAPPVMDTYVTTMGGQGARQMQGQLPNGQVRAISRPRQAYTDPVCSPNAPSPAASAGANRTGTPTKRPTGTPVASTSAVAPTESPLVSPRMPTNGHMRGGELQFPQLTDEQTSQMRSEVADSMFTEFMEGEESQGRICVLCDHRKRLGIINESPQQFFKPTTEEMYSHLLTQHPESLEMGERDWQMDLFGIGPLRDQQQ